MKLLINPQIVFNICISHKKAQNSSYKHAAGTLAYKHQHSHKNINLSTMTLK